MKISDRRYTELKLATHAAIKQVGGLEIFTGYVGEVDDDYIGRVKWMRKSLIQLARLWLVSVDGKFDLYKDGGKTLTEYNLEVAMKKIMIEVGIVTPAKRCK